MTALEAVHEVARELGAAGVPSPRVDAEHLVAHVLGLSRSGVYSSDMPVVADRERVLRSLVERRRAREPLAYVLGEWGFRRLTLRVDGRALVPRPETEVVVERCLEHLRGLEEPRVLDVGVGSGAIALSLADEHPGARVVGVDSSEEALSLARENVADAAVNDRIQLSRRNLLQGVRGLYDLVVSNPPYVSPGEYETLQPEIRLWEPREAIVGVGVGEAVAQGARDVLRPGGWFVLECGDGQAAGLAASLRSLGYESVAAFPDLAGRGRVVEGRRPS
jgi:release factor glutamine methyltransferase